MHDQNDTPEAKAAALAALQASIAWYDERRAQGSTAHCLPESATSSTHGERNYKAAVTELARVAGLDLGEADQHSRNNFLFYLVATELGRNLDSARPSGTELQDLCQSMAAELHLPFTRQMGMTEMQLFTFVKDVHQRQHPGCGCLQIAEMYLTGRTTDGRRFR